jgi:hypothetical protein
VSDKGSPKIVAASPNATPCLMTLDFALAHPIQNSVAL